ncbi:DUF4269 domain-containing protein [Pedobacter aquatilis]|uniref:DUF4269 domain-containing protein n=1 Tax=Pedobacter aquatilis TaxID=351343 RepID=UPI00292DAFE9|nr:DUF4269 domain-containing protein [Pedobacter aquatilis]
MINFLDISYLKTGTERQRKAYQVLTERAILENLAQYNPILTGTIPINIDIENSDLDIICSAQDDKKFENDLTYHFKHERGFNITKNKKFNALKANFFIDDFEIEIFGQNIPTKQQNAYRHMLIEYKILQEKGEDFRMQIIELKKQGYKTEPAFTRLLNLQGDPYEALLRMQI